MTIDRETIRFYDAQTEAYKKLAGGFENISLTRMVATLSNGAHVLDLGCGPGQDAAQMVKAGLRVTAMDASAEMLRQAEKIEGVTTLCATFDELDDHAAFDAVWASFSLLHARKSDFPRHLTAICRALKPGGTLVISMKTGIGEERDKLGRFYAYYEENELTGLLAVAGFKIEDIARGKAKGMVGTDDPFIVVTAHA